MRHLLPLSLLLCLATAGCRSGVPYPERMYLEVLELVESHDGTGGLRHDVREEMDEDFATVVRWAQEGKLESAEDYLYAAGTLLCSDRIQHLELSLELSLQAAELGEPRAYPTHAHAADKLDYHLGEPHQRYGTHSVYKPVLRRFEIHPPVDPDTTDDERRAMGIPPLAELEAQVVALNESVRTQLLRDRVQGDGD